MGGNSTGNYSIGNGFKVFGYESKIPVPSYLLNLAVGDL
jgi:aminopeptidase N